VTTYTVQTDVRSLLTETKTTNRLVADELFEKKVKAMCTVSRWTRCPVRITLLIDEAVEAEFYRFIENK
jgi:organic hydroperoxide reductase OsmC/OhrA